jgi:S-formylglutathione hydrolase FrmB
MVNAGVLPGKQYLNEIDGACNVGAAPLVFATLGASIEGTFHSRARQRDVGYSLAYPVSSRPGDEVALVIMLHGFGGTHLNAFVDMTPAQASSLIENYIHARAPARHYAPVAVATVDGGAGYWNPHPGDDPMGMVVDEFIPMLQARGLGRSSHGVGLMGISMGGYGALAIAERYPEKFRAVAAISPAVWTSYDQARSANAGAFASAADFATNDIIVHAPALAHLRVRVASGVDDPFHPGVVELITALPAGAQTYVGGGCHSSPFFESQEPASLAFLSSHLD